MGVCTVVPCTATEGPRLYLHAPNVLERKEQPCEVGQDGSAHHVITVVDAWLYSLYNTCC